MIKGLFQLEILIRSHIMISLIHPCTYLCITLESFRNIVIEDPIQNVLNRGFITSSNKKSWGREGPEMINSVAQ